MQPEPLPAVWRSARACESHACCLVATEPGRAHMKDSKLVDSPVLSWDADAWRAFLNGVRRGEFDA